MRADANVHKAVGAVLDRGVQLARHTFMPGLGGRPDPARLARSKRFRDGRFQNAEPPCPVPPDARNDLLREFLRRDKRRVPSGEVPIVREVPAPATSGLHVTWLGHASTLVEIDGARLLFDPMLSRRSSPLAGVGPRRMHPVPRGAADLPELDAVVISHDHYDHLDRATIRALARTRAVPFVVPVGVAAHLRHWNVAEDRIIELDWDESTEIAGIRLTAAPAKHFSGRALTRNNTLWVSWVVAGSEHRLFYTGDSGYCHGYEAIGAEHGPFDATLVQVGAYNDAWPDVHMTPEEGVTAHREVRGEVMIPVHWCTFKLALHAWGEPVDRAWAEAKATGATIAVPRPGERIDIAAPPLVDAWWEAAR